jgi:hypothetical protein
MNEYLKSGMFGMSLKMWAGGGSNKKFTDAAGIQSHLDQIFS